MPFGIPKPPKEDPDFWFELTLTPKMRLTLLDLIRGHKTRKDIGAAKLRALETAALSAREVDLPPDVTLPWDELQKEADRQGVELLEVWYDRTVK